MSLSLTNYISKEQIAEIFKEYGGDANNTGSVEGQIALFTFRINALSEHLKKHKKDHPTRRSLMIMVGQRRRMLDYLASKDISKYRAIIVKLGIRK